MGVVKSNTTIVHVTFHTWRYGAIRLDGGNPGGGSPEVAGFGAVTPILSYGFSKRIGQPHGEMEIVLKGYAEGCTFEAPSGTQKQGKNGMPWLDLLSNGDWWEMAIERNGQKLAVSYGFIDKVAVSINANLGEGKVSITVTGRGAGFALAHAPLYFNPFDAAADNVVGVNMLSIIEGQSGDPATVIRNMITGLMGQKGGLLGGQIAFPPSLASASAAYWVNALDTDRLVQTNLRGRVLIPMSVLQAERTSGSLWEFIDTWRNPLMNELFIDVDPTYTGAAPWPVYLVLREKPFVNTLDGVDSPWYGLTTSKVAASSISSVSFTKGEHRVNHVLLMADNTGVLGQDSYGLHPPVADTDSIDQFGLSRLMERTNYFEDTGPEGAEAQLRSWRAMVVGWNALNHEYLQGSIVIPEARADIRVGQRLAVVDGPIARYTGFPVGTDTPVGVPDDALTFYVEAVRYEGSFGVSPMHRTQVLVSRGYLEGDRFLDLLAVYTKFQEFDAVPLGSEASPNDGDLNVNDPISPPEGTEYEVETAR